MNYLELNQIDEVAGVKVQCLSAPPDKEGRICYNCAFGHNLCYNSNCSSWQRKDNADVYFKKLKI